MLDTPIVALVFVSPIDIPSSESPSPSKLIFDNPQPMVEDLLRSSGSIPSLSSSSFDIGDASIFDHFVMNTDQVSSANVTGAVFTNTLPIVSTISTSTVSGTPAVGMDPNVSTSLLPPWLLAYMPKRKKQVISPDDFDFTKLVPAKPKAPKKLKILSSVLEDKGHKFLEIAKPPQDATIEGFDMNDYSISRVELGKITHESAKNDMQSTMDILI